MAPQPKETQRKLKEALAAKTTARRQHPPEAAVIDVDAEMDTDEADDFERFFGPDGLAWKTGTVCIEDSDGKTAADELCDNALDDALIECMDDPDTDTTDTASTGS